MIPPSFVIEHVMGGITPATGAPATSSVSPDLFASNKNYLGNEVLWLALPPDGHVRGRTVSITAYQTVPGAIDVRGRRLDRPQAGQVTTQRDENPGGGPRDRALVITFPTSGCWEITFLLNGHSLRSVFEVSDP
jgi:hypothetical protein